MRLEDLNPKYQAEAQRQLDSIARRQTADGKRQTTDQRRQTGQEGGQVSRVRLKSLRFRTPTKTELAFRREVLDRELMIGSLVSVAYEALVFRLANGHSYTPDWVCWDCDGRLQCVEVKGSYRLGSYQRARLAFDQARIEWPRIIWVWAERKKDGSWLQNKEKFYAPL
jgi:hypothetical protein